MMRQSLMTTTALIARTRTFLHGSSSSSSSCGSVFSSRIGLVAGRHLLVVVGPSLAMGGQPHFLARRGYQELAYSQRGEPVEQLEHYTSNDDWVPDPPTSCLSAFDKEDWILVELLAVSIFCIHVLIDFFSWTNDDSHGCTTLHNLIHTGS